MSSNHSVKSPVLLKTILDIAFWLLIFGLLGSILVTGAAFFYKFPVDLKINDYAITEFSTPVVLGIIFKIIIAIMVIYVVYLLRKVVRSFNKNKLFTSLQITGLKLIGQLIIITTIADMVLDFVLASFIEHKLRVGVDFDATFHSIWFTLALGLFFILLSQSFSYAKRLREENDFTV